jgi:pimeloyl-ACP methyl ester carboxylesterase
LLIAIVLPVLGVIWLIQGAYSIHRYALPQRTIVIDSAGCRMPTTIFDPAGASPFHEGSVVIFHGLSANRRIMFYLGQNLAFAGQRVFIPDLPGHGDNTDAFSFAHANECAAAALESLIRSHQIDPNTTVLVGHSMGAAIAISMADREPVAATIAISPGPLVMPKRMPSNLLVFVAQFDIPAVKREAEAIAAAAGLNRTSPDDFAQDRAFDLVTLPHAVHTSGLYSPEVIGQSFEWIRQALSTHPITDSTTPPGTLYRLGEVIEAPARVATGSLIGLLGILVLFLPCVALAGRISAPAIDEPSDSATFVFTSRGLAVAEMAVCALAGVFLLKLGVPLRFLRIYSGSYLASLFLIVGALLLALNRTAAKQSWQPLARQALPAAVLAFATFLALGGWLNWQLTDLWMNYARWLRFAALLPLIFVFTFAEETVLGPIGSGPQRALRYLVFLLLRSEIWLACLLAFYELNSGEFLILLLAVFFALFSLLQRLATDALRRRTGSATAAALFGAILLAWFIAAVFPLS